MTVKELRQLLFDVENQDAEVVVVTQFKFGKVETTKDVATVGRKDDPAGFVTISLGG